MKMKTARSSKKVVIAIIKKSSGAKLETVLIKNVKKQTRDTSFYWDICPITMNFHVLVKWLFPDACINLDNKTKYFKYTKTSNPV